MKLADYCTGIQHIGIPTGDIKKSESFYSNLGFEVVYKDYVEKDNANVIFMKMGNLLLEIYEGSPAMCDGAINHMALDCTDVEKAFELAMEQGYTLLSEGIESLDFWDNGIKFFIIEGPNRERIEYCQII